MYLTPVEFLNLWQKYYGTLDSDLQNTFLKHRRLSQILLFEQVQIEAGLKKYRKLDDLFNFLDNQIIPSMVEKGQKRIPVPRASGIRRSFQPGLRNVANKEEVKRTTVKKPGKREQRIPGRLICQSCGSVIRGNDLRCKCS